MKMCIDRRWPSSDEKTAEMIALQIKELFTRKQKGDKPVKHTRSSKRSIVQQFECTKIDKI